MIEQKSASPRIVLTGLGHYFPETVMDNKFFEALDINTTEEWIEQRIGIKTRRSVLALDDIRRLRKGEVTYVDLMKEGRVMSMVDMCRQPWQMALDRSGARERGVTFNMVVGGTSVPDYDVSANACYIAEALGLECLAFDANSACSTFVLHLHMLRGLLTAGVAKNAVSFVPERYSIRQNFADRASSIIFGDASVAAVLETDTAASGFELVDTIFTSAPSGAKQIVMPDGGMFVQNGSAVQKFAITSTVASTKEILSRNNLTVNDIGYFISHQANLRMLESVVSRLELPANKHLFNIDEFGNQGAAGAPAVLSMNWEKVQKGEFVVMTVVGGGLSWGSALLKRI